MLLESLVKATVELQGFRVVTVTGDAGGLVADWPQTGVSCPDAASVGRGARTETPVRYGASAMYRCGGSRWRCAMRRAAWGARVAPACMSSRCPGCVGSSR